jgi:hypothetical protein
MKEGTMQKKQGFDISSINSAENLTVWVEYNDQVSVLLRHITREDLAGILKRATRTTWDKQHQPEELIDNIKYGELVGDAAIVDWTGLLDAGQAFPCTPENKALVMRKWSNFAKFVSDLSSDLDRMVEIEKDVVRKNSLNTFEQS